MTYGLFEVPEVAPPPYKVPEPKMKITQQELREQKVPLGHRNWCAHLVENLKKCKQMGLNSVKHYACLEEKEAYAWCSHVEYARRVLKVREKKAEIRAIQAQGEAAAAH